MSCQEPLLLDTFYLYGLIYVYAFLSCVHNGFVLYIAGQGDEAKSE